MSEVATLLSDIVLRAPLPVRELLARSNCDNRAVSAVPVRVVLRIMLGEPFAPAGCCIPVCVAAGGSSKAVTLGEACVFSMILKRGCDDILLALA